MNSYRTWLMASIALALCSCSTERKPNQPLAESVDIDRFMGVWHVHGYTPTAIDKQAWNATETYELRADGRIQTEYRFRKGSPTGKEKIYRPVGTIIDSESNAHWRMRFFGVINADYYIVYVDSEYQHCVIGHPNRKYAWIMSRSREIDSNTYSSLLAELDDRDYDLTRVQRVPQEWPSEG